MKIAVDAMGGDHAPREVVRGAVESARSNGLSLILVGREERIREELRAVDVSGADIEVVHASEVVEMCDVPGIALRKKRDSSIRVVLRLVAEEASSFVSAKLRRGDGRGLLILKKITA
jgi:glycerol-3-phosphate acyltransferase PlsX